MARYATLETKSADLATEFGLSWAIKLFGASTIASLPIRISGKNKGSPKGFVIWRRAITAGYCRECCAPLAIGGLADAWIGAGPVSGRDHALMGHWHGRVQSLAGGRASLFAAGRARHARDQIRHYTDLAEQSESETYRARWMAVVAEWQAIERAEMAAEANNDA